MRRASGARAVLLAGAGWLLVAGVLVVRLLEPPAPPFVLFGLTAVLLGLAWGHAGFREWVVLLLSGRPRGGARRAAYLVWSVYGLIDLLFVVLTAGQLGLEDPASMAELLELPLSLLPTFLVPILVASHLVLGARLLRRRPGHDL